MRTEIKLSTRYVTRRVHAKRMRKYLRRIFEGTIDDDGPFDLFVIVDCFRYHRNLVKVAIGRYRCKRKKEK